VRAERLPRHDARRHAETLGCELFATIGERHPADRDAGVRYGRVRVRELDPVHFIRHLPKLTAEEIAEMEKFNPKSPAEGRQIQDEATFLAGGEEADPAAAASDGPAHQH